MTISVFLKSVENVSYYGGYFMNNTLKFLISLGMVAFLMFQTVQGMEGFEEQRQKSPGIQLLKGADNTLEVFLGLGEKNLLKLSVGLSDFKIPHGKEQVEVPVRLFLTNWEFSPTDHPPVILQIIMDCEQTPLTCSLPRKPSSFDSYGQFADWLGKGYLTNQTTLSYDFEVDIPQVAPSLAQYLGSPGCYHFIGTHTIDNTTIIYPDQLVSHVSYSSQRDNKNTTTATLGGTFYLNGCPYSVDAYRQKFFHPVVEEIILERNATQKFYSYQWIAQSKVTKKVAYREFPKSQIKNWPNAPSRTYHLVRKSYEDLEYIRHVSCWDGDSGQKVNISDGQVFLIVHEEIQKEADNARYLESIVKDDLGKLYTMHYQYKKQKQSRRKSWQSTVNEKITEITELPQHQSQQEWLMPIHQIMRAMTPTEFPQKKETPCRRYKSKTPPLLSKKEEGVRKNPELKIIVSRVPNSLLKGLKPSDV